MPIFIPGDLDIKAATKDVSWEFAVLHAAATEMVTTPRAPYNPLNHLVAEAFMVHVRNLAEFFCKGLNKFTTNPTARRQDRDADLDNIFAVDFCVSDVSQSIRQAKWEPFGDQLNRKSNLIVAINKTLSHMTYARQNKRVGSDFPFEAHDHAHGTLKLLRKTWDDFIASVHPEFQRPAHHLDIDHWLIAHTENPNGRWRIPFRDSIFEQGVRHHKWAEGQTPNGPVP